MNDVEADLPQEVPQSWLEALKRADVDLATGRTASWAEVRARLTAIQDEIEAASTHLQA